MLARLGSGGTGRWPSAGERHAAEGRWYSGVELHRLWNVEKKSVPGLAWWDQNSKRVCQESFRDLDRALRGFLASRQGRRKGRRVGFPKFKKRGRARGSFRFSTGAMRCAGRAVTLPRLGAIATFESTRKLRNQGTSPDARPRTQVHQSTPTHTRQPTAANPSRRSPRAHKPDVSHPA